MNGLRSRFIPVLLMDNGGLTKTINFEGQRYLGDPINTILTFNEKFVDELALFDIKISQSDMEIDLDFLDKCARNAAMPLCYGGGVKSVDLALKIISIGFEKVSINSALFQNPDLVNNISNSIGAQSTVICLDIKCQQDGIYVVCSNRGKEVVSDLPEFLSRITQLKFGELIIHNIDRDGTKLGLDRELMNIVASSVNCPITFVGGAHSKQELLEIASEGGLFGLGAGSAFIYSGKNDAVLPNYIPRHSKRT